MHYNFRNWGKGKCWKWHARWRNEGFSLFVVCLVTLVRTQSQEWGMRNNQLKCEFAYSILSINKINILIKLTFADKTDKNAMSMHTIEGIPCTACTLVFFKIGSPWYSVRDHRWGLSEFGIKAIDVRSEGDWECASVSALYCGSWLRRQWTRWRRGWRN